jgi:hypothetical protein
LSELPKDFLFHAEGAAWAGSSASTCAARLVTHGPTWLRSHDETVRAFNQSGHFR